MSAFRALRAFKLPVALFAFSALLTTPVPAQRSLQDERAVKAAFVFNLTKYVEWPNPASELLIGYVGDPLMGETLQKLLEGKTSDSRIIHVLIAPSDQDLTRCALLYIAEPSSRKLHALLERVRDRNTLTVGDSGSFAKEGGMVGLVRNGDQVQIQVNLQAAQAAQLKISSRLLNLSTIIRDGKEVR